MPQQTASPHGHRDLEPPATLARIQEFLLADQIPTIFLDCGRNLPQADSAGTTGRELERLAILQTIWEHNKSLFFHII